MCFAPFAISLAAAPVAHPWAAAAVAMAAIAYRFASGGEPLLADVAGWTFNVQPTAHNGAPWLLTDNGYTIFFGEVWVN